MNIENPNTSNETVPDTLEQELVNSGIDISQWGKGQAKTLAHLQEEIENGETILVRSEQGEILRKVVVGGADIFYVSKDGKKFHLREDRQVFKDGRERRRDMAQSVSEKMKPDESPQDSMIRGVREELGIEGEISLTETGTNEELINSPSYPGLKSQYVRHEFAAVLSDDQFKPEGYIEEQDDKTTYFVWEELQ